MKTGYGFTEFENINEFKSWLAKQNPSRTINKLQVHHMWMPDYSCWATDNALRRQNNIKSFHINTNGWSDIAQHFSIFPDGHIVTGRSLNSTPIGIKGWNTGAICIEIYGNFDKGHDTITAAQKNAVIAAYALLADKFKISISSSGIRPHCWFTAGGTYLGDFDSARSSKTCPGTGFFGGNTKASFEKNFYPAIKNYLSGGSTAPDPDPTPDDTVVDVADFVVRVKVDSLNIRKGPGTSYEKVGSITDKGAYTITSTNKAGSWGKLKSGLGWICIDSAYVDRVGTTPQPPVSKEFVVRVKVDALNIRKGPGTSYEKVGSIRDKGAYTIVETSGDWGRLKSGLGWICIDSAYVDRV